MGVDDGWGWMMDGGCGIGEKRGDEKGMGRGD